MWKPNGLFIESSPHLLLNYNLSFFFHPPLFIYLGNATNRHTLKLLPAAHTGAQSTLTEVQHSPGHAQVAAYFSYDDAEHGLNDKFLNS